MPKPKTRPTQDDPKPHTEKGARPRRMRPITETAAPATPAAQPPTKGGKDQDLPVKILHFPDHLTNEGAASTALTSPFPGKGVLHPLPEPLCALIRAAAIEQGLPLLTIPGWGRLADSDRYVLTCAAYYAIQCEPEKQLRDLWAIHAVWHASL